MITRVLKIDPERPDIDLLLEAASVIRRGGLVAFPTETVYGLGADGLNVKAVKSIFMAKGRPADNPLILHVSSPAQVEKIAYPTPLADKLMQRFWPGPLTLVMRANKIVPDVVTGGLGTVAVRMPQNAVARLLINYSGVPIAGPSANKSGRPSPTDAKAVIQDLGDVIDIVLDAGPANVGVESTVLDVTGDKACLLRPGGLSLEQISSAGAGVELEATLEQKKMSPGTRYRHYAPSVPLFLYEGEDIKLLLKGYRKVGYIGISKPPFFVGSIILFPDLDHYARGLFSAIREMEAAQVDAILAEMPSPKGIGLALRDRLTRASGG